MPGTATRRPIDLSDLFAKRARQVEVAWGDGEDEAFVVAYSPDAYTMEVHARLQLMGEQDGLDATADLMATLISGWDITDNGAPYPITKDNLVRLGLPLLMAISEAVQMDFSLGKKTTTGLSLASNGT